MNTVTEKLRCTNPRKKGMKNLMIVYLRTTVVTYLNGKFCFDGAAVLSVYAGTLLRIVNVTLRIFLTMVTNLLTKTDGPNTQAFISSNAVTRFQYWTRSRSDSIHLSFSVLKINLTVILPVLYRSSKWLLFKTIYHLPFVVIFTRYILRVCVILFAFYNHLSWFRRFCRPKNTRRPVCRHK